MALSLNSYGSIGIFDKVVLFYPSMVRASFSISINGRLSEPFLASNGLQQGNPIAPLLFVIAMEAFSQMMDRVVATGEVTPLKHGWVSISHLMYADDLMVFSDASRTSVLGIAKLLSKFANLF